MTGRDWADERARLIWPEVFSLSRRDVVGRAAQALRDAKAEERDACKKAVEVVGMELRLPVSQIRQFIYAIRNRNTGE